MNPGPSRRPARGGGVVAWVFVASVATASCTRVLGIDGNYVVASAGGAGTGGASGATGTTSSGGMLGGGGVGDVPGSGGDGRRDSGSSGSGSGGTMDEPDAAPPLGGASAGGTPSVGGATNSGGTTSAGGTPSSIDAGKDGSTTSVLCRAGTYTGRFTGNVQLPPIPDVPNVPIGVQGNVTLHVTPGTTSALYAVTGELGPDSKTALDGLVPVTSDVAGTFDCKTGALVANLDNGQVRAILVYAFEGTLTATYDESTHEFNGSWTESESGPPPAGSGTGDISKVVWATP